jgi:hypothetical protein
LFEGSVEHSALGGQQGITGGGRRQSQLRPAPALGLLVRLREDQLALALRFELGLLTDLSGLRARPLYYMLGFCARIAENLLDDLLYAHVIE